MPQFHETIMGKRFIEGTIPSLVRAVETLTEKLEVKEEPKVEYEKMIALLYVNDHIDGRKVLENIENQKFDSLQDLHDINDGISVYSLTDFMDICNNNDSECDELHIQDRWVGYIQLKKGAIQEHRNS